MQDNSWLKQTPEKPLFEDMLWSRPENKRHAGKLLIVGGDGHSFSSVSDSFLQTKKAGIGVVRVLLPISFEKLLGKTFPDADFAPATLSGSFAREALATLLDNAQWANGVLLAGNFGKNSETAILLENFVKKYSGPLILSGDCLEYFYNEPERLLDRRGTTVVGSFQQTQRILSGRLLIKSSMNLFQIVEQLKIFSSNCPATIVTNFQNQILAAQDGKVSSAAATVSLDRLAAYISVWMIQHPDQGFEAINCAVYELIKS